MHVSFRKDMHLYRVVSVARSWPVSQSLRFPSSFDEMYCIPYLLKHANQFYYSRDNHVAADAARNSLQGRSDPKRLLTSKCAPVINVYPS